MTEDLLMPSFFSKRAQALQVPLFEEALFWTIHLEAIDDDEALEAKKLLDQRTQETLSLLATPEDQKKRFICHAILRFFLAKLLQKTPEHLNVVKNSFGKPYLADHLLHFNLSHTKKYAFFGIHPKRAIGVDIEEIQHLDASDLWVADKEKSLMLSSQMDPQQFLLGLWCAKEALIKAWGTGFSSAELPEFQNIKKLDAHTYLYLSYGAGIVVYTRKVPHHFLAICVEPDIF